MKLTKEQAVAMTREQVLAADFRYVANAMQDYPEFHELVLEMFSTVVGEWVHRLERAFATREDMTGLVESFKKEPHAVQMLVWNRATWGGIEQIDFCKFVHSHFATPILELFGIVIEPDNVPSLMAAFERR